MSSTVLVQSCVDPLGAGSEYGGIVHHHYRDAIGANSSGR